MDNFSLWSKSKVKPLPMILHWMYTCSLLHVLCLDVLTCRLPVHDLYFHLWFVLFSSLVRVLKIKDFFWTHKLIKISWSWFPRKALILMASYCAKCLQIIQKFWGWKRRTTGETNHADRESDSYLEDFISCCSKTMAIMFLLISVV